MIIFCSGSPSITGFSHISSQDQSLTLTCSTRHSPPTKVFLYKDGRAVDIDWNTIKMVQRVTSRQYSYQYYEITFFIQMDPDEIVGQYTCKVQNTLGSSGISTAISLTGKPVIKSL